MAVPREALAARAGGRDAGVRRCTDADSEMLGYFRGSLANIQIELGEIGAAIENSRMSLAIYERTKAAGHS